MKLLTRIALWYFNHHLDKLYDRELEYLTPIGWMRVIKVDNLGVTFRLDEATNFRCLHAVARRLKTRQQQTKKENT